MTAPEETLSLLRQVLELPGASLRVYHVAGSLSGENWQCGITWDTAKGINSGFHVACRHDPVASLTDGCRHVLEHKIKPTVAAVEEDDFGLALSHSVSIVSDNDVPSIDDMLG